MRFYCVTIGTYFERHSRDICPSYCCWLFDEFFQLNDNFSKFLVMFRAMTSCSMRPLGRACSRVRWLGSCLVGWVCGWPLVCIHRLFPERSVRFRWNFAQCLLVKIRRSLSISDKSRLPNTPSVGDFIFRFLFGFRWLFLKLSSEIQQNGIILL